MAIAHISKVAKWPLTNGAKVEFKLEVNAHKSSQGSLSHPNCMGNFNALDVANLVT